MGTFHFETRAACGAPPVAHAVIIMLCFPAAVVVSPRRFRRGRGAPGCAPARAHAAREGEGEAVTKSSNEKHSRRKALAASIAAAAAGAVPALPAAAGVMLSPDGLDPDRRFFHTFPPVWRGRPSHAHHTTAVPAVGPWARLTCFQTPSRYWGNLSLLV